jgi:23S rRNA (cytosine1962-C5)-methyltransferase
LSQKEWACAHARFESSTEEHGGHWITATHLPERWLASYNQIKFWVQLSASRHVGVFPEQAAHWDWIQGCIHKAGRPIKVLNLFGYTGLASLAAAAAGAEVTHLDASRKVVDWAKANQQASGLDGASIRYIVDDALKFVQREGRRGMRYDGLILDPPKFGRGPKGEVWEFYKLIPTLLDTCKEIMTAQPSFLVMTAYAVKASSLTLFNALTDLFGGLKGQCEAGELALIEKSAGRRLSTAVYARWFSK